MADLPNPNPSDGKPEPTPYDLEPAAPPPPPAPASPLSPAGAAPGAGKVGKLSDKGLTDDFPEDADFSHDPEVDRVVRGDTAAKKPADETVDEGLKERPPFIRSGMGNAQTVALVGAGLAIAAVIAAGANTTSGWFSAGVLAAYFVVIHTVTGVCALAAAAQLNEQPLGPMELGAARMLVCVSLFMTLMNLHVTSYHIIEPVFGALAYWLALTLLFRLTIGRLLMVGIIHIGFAVIIWLGMIIYSWAGPVAKA